MLDVPWKSVNLVTRQVLAALAGESRQHAEEQIAVGVQAPVPESWADRGSSSCACYSTGHHAKNTRKPVPPGALRFDTPRSM
jgi:hypothetical protein